MENENEKAVKIGLGVWVCLCVLLAMWVFTKFFKQRQQMYLDLNVVEESLRKMQEKIEDEQNKKSIGFVENMEDITACLTKNFNENQTRDEFSEEIKRMLTSENEINKVSTNETIVEEETVEDDKKNI